VANFKINMDDENRKNLAAAIKEEAARIAVPEECKNAADRLGLDPSKLDIKIISCDGKDVEFSMAGATTKELQQISENMRPIRIDISIK